jgi:hypothetical protein
MFAAGVSPDEAASNLAGWAGKVGLDFLAVKLNSAATDQWGFLIGALIVAAALLLPYATRKRKKTAPQENARIPEDRLKLSEAKKAPADIINSQEDLEDLSHRLGDYANNYSYAEILIANVKYLPLAKALTEAFDAADWRTHLNTVPQENHPPRYIEGVNIMARNKSLLDVICGLLSEYGVPDIRPEYRGIADGIAPSKWHHSHNRIEIMIGHH